MSRYGLFGFGKDPKKQGTTGHLDQIAVEEVRPWEQEFLSFIRENKKPIWQKIADTKQMDDATMAEVEKAIAEFQKQYAGKKEKQTVRA